MREVLKTGAWLTAARLRRYPAILLILFLAAIAGLCLTARGERDYLGRPLGTDFSDIWVAGLEADQGHPAQAYDRVAHQAAQQAQFGALDGYYVWPYPPYFLAVAALLGLAPYLAALVIWQGATLPLYLAAVFAALRPARLPRLPVLVAALAFPAVFINLSHGQNGFLTAALLTGGLLMLDRDAFAPRRCKSTIAFRSQRLEGDLRDAQARAVAPAALSSRPILAGVIFALLAYKPHLALVIPAALVAGRHWRALGAAVAAVIAMSLASFLAFGAPAWQGFLAGTAFTRTVILEEGALGFGKLQSPFAALRLLGGPVPLAYAGQAAVTIAALAALAWLWRGHADARLKAAALLAACLIATPYVVDYDMVVLAPALAFAVSYGMEKGFAPFEKSGLALIWIMPLLARPLGGFGVPFGAPVLALFFVGLILRARRDLGDDPVARHRSGANVIDRLA